MNITPQHQLQDWVASCVQAGKPLTEVLTLAFQPELKDIPNVEDELRLEYGRCKQLADERRAENERAMEAWRAEQAARPVPPPVPTPTVEARRKEKKADNPIAHRRRFRREAYVISADPPAIRDGEIWKRIPEAPDYSFSNYHQVKRNRGVRGATAGTVIIPGFGKKGHTRWKLVVGKGKRKTFYAFKLADDLDFAVSESD